MTEIIKSESELVPEKLERNRLLEEHRRLSEDLVAIEPKINSFFQQPHQGHENRSVVAEMTDRRQDIVNRLKMIEQELIDLDDHIPA